MRTFQIQSAIILCLSLMVLLMAPAAAHAETLNPGDTIRVWVKGEPELTVERNLGADGSINYPLLGNVQIGGMSTVEAGRQLARLLDDGYLREPLVQVSLVTKAFGAPVAPPRPSAASPAMEEESAPEAAPAPSRPSSPTVGAPLARPAPASRPAASVPLTVIIADRASGNPVGQAALLLGGKIYQSNKQGKMVLEESRDRVILLADGYRPVQAALDSILESGDPARIMMDPIELAAEVTVRVVDERTNEPMGDVTVRLNNMKVKTNRQGMFRIKDIRNEFGEIELVKRGYRPLRRVLDFKDPSERVLPLARND